MYSASSIPSHVVLRYFVAACASVREGWAGRKPFEAIPVIGQMPGKGSSAGVGDANMAEFGMAQAMQQFTIDNKTCANTGADGDIQVLNGLHGFEGISPRQLRSRRYRSPRGVQRLIRFCP